MNDEQEINLKLTVTEFYELQDAISFTKGELMIPTPNEVINRRNKASVFTLMAIQEKIWKIRCNLLEQKGEE